MDKYSLKPFSCTSGFIGKIPVIFIIGDVTSGVKNPLLDEVEKIAENAQKTAALHFGESFYINSSGVADILKVIRSARNRNINIVIYKPNSYINSIFQIIGLYEVADLIESEDELLKLAGVIQESN